MGRGGKMVMKCDIYVGNREMTLDTSIEWPSGVVNKMPVRQTSLRLLYGTSGYVDIPREEVEKVRVYWRSERKEHKAMPTLIVLERLQDLKRQHYAGVWEGARLLAGTTLGPKRRSFLYKGAAHPTLEERVMYMARPA